MTKEIPARKAQILARKNAALQRLAQKAAGNGSDTANLNARRQFLLTMAQSIG